MGKSTKKQSQPADDKSYESDTGDRTGASQNEEHVANHAPLTLAAMEKLFLSMEERIIAKLSVQLSADRATIDRHDQTIQGMEIHNKSSNKTTNETHQYQHSSHPKVSSGTLWLFIVDVSILQDLRTETESSEETTGPPLMLENS
ncbi:hypothetical protein F7725_016221 [Dissostichus mawsoni]|uniref:Uncharacterized protein n=1 Tax=Dissostichus mawsoni TaxID=36200 RepID=A0A7J5Z5B1_DISMA|nr:hypothetical protein F7725_016221 [Dissostichus mawsoni]